MPAAAQRFAEVAGDGAHIGAGAHGDGETQVRRRPAFQGEIVDGDGAGHDRNGLAAARGAVGGHAVDFDSAEGRRHLLHGAAEGVQGAVQVVGCERGDGAFGDDGPFGVVGIGAES